MCLCFFFFFLFLDPLLSAGGEILNFLMCEIRIIYFDVVSHSSISQILTSKAFDCSLLLNLTSVRLNASRFLFDDI